MMMQISWKDRIQDRIIFKICSPKRKGTVRKTDLYQYSVVPNRA